MKDPPPLRDQPYYNSKFKGGAHVGIIVFTFVQIRACVYRAKYLNFRIQRLQIASKSTSKVISVNILQTEF
jgi:hypothetical protein